MVVGGGGNPKSAGLQWAGGHMRRQNLGAVSVEESLNIEGVLLRRCEQERVEEHEVHLLLPLAAYRLCHFL